MFASNAILFIIGVADILFLIFFVCVYLLSVDFSCIEVFNFNQCSVCACMCVYSF